MAITKAQSSVWAAEVLANLNPNLVFGTVCNTDYEGEIQGAGSQVKIISIAAVTSGAYTSGTDITINAMTDAETNLLIDQSPWAGFYLDDVDKAQSRPDLYQAGMAEMGFAIANAMDTYVAGLHGGADSGNLIGSTGTPTTITTASDAYDNLVALGKLLSKQNVPKAGRWVIVPPDFTALLQKDNRIVGAGAPQDVLKTGKVATLAGFDIYESNNVANTTGTKYKIMAGYAGSIAFAGQLERVEFSRKEKGFGGYAKALAVFGAKVTRPKSLAVLTANFS